MPSLRLVVALALSLAIASVACGGTDRSVGGVKAANNTPFGPIVTDASGRTLYMLSTDQPNTSTCSGACAQDWPPLKASGTPDAGTGVNAKMLAIFTRTDGAAQVTLAGQPLYYFYGDKQPGDIKGQGVIAYGGKWYVLSSSGQAITTPLPVGTQEGFNDMYP